MFTLGLTGQTGAGKSTVAEYISEKYPLINIDTDSIARKITDTEEVKKALGNAFGGDIFDGEGRLMRRVLAKRAFATPENTALLNRITHPAIMREVTRLINKAEAEGYAGAVIDGAALIESGFIKNYTTSLCVIADKSIRKNRIMLRDGISEADADIRISAQKPDGYYTSNTEHCIINNDLAETLRQTDMLIKKFNIPPKEDTK